MTDHIRFVGRFVDTAELALWLEAADIFLTPYPNLEQIVSGTLSYAMGAGKAIVSTPYAYAVERLTRLAGDIEFIAVDYQKKLWGSKHSPEILDV